MRKRLLFWCTGVLLMMIQSQCTHLESASPVTVSTAEPWVILPLQNLAETPRAGERVESILQSTLQNQGVHQLAICPNNTENLALLLNDGKRLATAKEWAKTKGFRIAVTGTIQEWNYRTGLDREPAVGITLQLVDLQNNDALLWTATASRTGWGSENLTETTTKVLNAMLGEMELKP